MSSLNTAKHKGFTLIELLAVVIVLSFIAGLMIPSLRSDPNRLAENASQQFVSQINLLSEEAALRGMEFGLVVEENRYFFVNWNEQEDRWQAMPIQRYAKTIQLPEIFTLDLELGDENALPMLESDEFSQNNNQVEEPIPQVAILSSGEITPFTLAMQVGDNDARLLISYSLQGVIEVERESTSF